MCVKSKREIWKKLDEKRGSETKSKGKKQGGKKRITNADKIYNEEKEKTIGCETKRLRRKIKLKE